MHAPLRRWCRQVIVVRPGRIGTSSDTPDVACKSSSPALQRGRCFREPFAAVRLVLARLSGGEGRCRCHLTQPSHLPNRRANKTLADTIAPNRPSRADAASVAADKAPEHVTEPPLPARCPALTLGVNQSQQCGRWDATQPLRVARDGGSCTGASRRLRSTGWLRRRRAVRRGRGERRWG